MANKTLREIIDGIIDICPQEMQTSSFKLYVNQEAYFALGCSEGEEPTIYRNFFVVCEQMPVNVICNIRDVPQTNKIEALYNEEENKLADLKYEREIFEPYCDGWKTEILKLRKNIIADMFQAVGKEKESLKSELQTYKDVHEAQRAFIDKLTEKRNAVVTLEFNPRHFSMDRVIREAQKICIAEHGKTFDEFDILIEPIRQGGKIKSFKAFTLK